MSAELPTIHIVDDDKSFRRALGRLLRVNGYRTALHASAAAFLQSQISQERGCIILDVQMPGLSGPELQQMLFERDLWLPIVFVTGHGDIPTTVKAIKAGAEDFLLKPVSEQNLLNAIQRALARCDREYEQRRRLDGMRTLVGKLTPREREVFALVVRGKLNKQIAHDLGTSERTIKAHRHSIMEKLQVRSWAEAVSMAEQLGLLEPRSAKALEQ